VGGQNDKIIKGIV